MAGKTMKNPDVANADSAEMIATDEKCMCPQCGYEGDVAEFNEAVDEGEQSERLKGKNDSPASELKKKQSPRDMMAEMDFGKLM